MTFHEWNQLFNAQNLFAFNGNPEGLLWLKVRAVCRGKLLKLFLETNNISLSSKTAADKNKELFELLQKDIDKGTDKLNTFLKNQNNEWYNQLGVDEEQLKNDLYSVTQYEWGGDQNNSLDKYLVSHYVKDISKYSDLTSRQSEIKSNAWNYVQTSWYNNWTSYLVESIFKKHDNVISSVGENKSVDFFINDYPIDLKITFFPRQYMAEKMKEELGTKELSWLKTEAKKVGITIDNSIPDSQLFYMLTEQLSQSGHDDILQKLRDARAKIISDAQENPEPLIVWLYANQGEMRFGAENRIYLIVVDSMDIAQSWKLKRNFNLIQPKVQEYLDHFQPTTLKEITFLFQGKEYKSLSDIIFIVKQ